MPVAVAALAQCTLFSGVSSQLVQQVADSMRLLSLRRREVLADAAACLPGLGVVLSGALQAVDETADGREVALETVGVNQAFGVAELIAARALPVTWMAATTGTTVGLLPREQAMALLHEPEVALRAAQSLAQRVCDTRSLQKVLTVHPVSARVCAWLSWQRSPEQNGVQVSLRLPSPPPALTADPVQLQQAILNLIVNAVDALRETPPEARSLAIEVSAEPAGGVRFAVHDSGPGVAPDSQARLFDAFFSTKPDGLGMGLAISRSIIENHGGRLWLDRTQPGGACFVFTIPDA